MLPHASVAVYVRSMTKQPVPATGSVAVQVRPGAGSQASDKVTVPTSTAGSKAAQSIVASVTASAGAVPSVMVNV